MTSVSGGSISTTFTYDANGNQTSGLGRSITYTSYNKPASITQGTRTIAFLDDSEHQRFKQVTPEGTTLYFDAFGVHVELFRSVGNQWNEYLSVGGRMISLEAIMQKRASKEAAAAGVALVVLMTHGTTEASIRDALARAVDDGFVREKPQVIRIEKN